MGSFPSRFSRCFEVLEVMNSSEYRSASRLEKEQLLGLKKVWGVEVGSKSKYIFVIWFFK